MLELKSAVIFANGKKLTIPNVDKVIVAVRDKAAVQHQASVDVTIDNIDQLRKIIRRV